ncbi:hypothetical protein D3C85_459800 [compost metagenome]
MQQQNIQVNPGAAEPSILQTKRVTMHELVNGAILDKRRVAISPQRLGRAIATIDPALGDAIITKGIFTIVSSALTLEQVTQMEVAMGSVDQAGAAYAGGRMALNPYNGGAQLSITVFGEDFNHGVQISVHQSLMQPAAGYGEGAAINILLSHMLKEDAVIDLGFGR